VQRQCNFFRYSVETWLFQILQGSVAT